MKTQDGDWEVTNEPDMIVMRWTERDTLVVHVYDFPEVALAKDLRNMLDVAIWEQERMSS